MRRINKPLLFVISFLLILASCSSGPHADHEEESGHDDEKHADVIHLSKDVLENLDLQWTSAKEAPLVHEVRVTGKAVQDTDKVDYIFAPASGTVAEIFVAVGDQVKRGQVLLQVDGRKLTAPRGGTVLAINATTGSRVGTMQSLAVLADIDTVRVVFDVYPGDIDYVKIGQKVDVTLIGHPEEIFSGQVRYLSPSLDEHSQTLKVAADVANTDHHLKFGMFVEGKILAPLTEKALLIPETAVVRFDKDSAVFLPGDEDGSFVKREIMIGRRGGGQVEVLSGLKTGDKVVTKGSFTLKAESLRGQLGEGHSH